MPEEGPDVQTSRPSVGTGGGRWDGGVVGPDAGPTLSSCSFSFDRRRGGAHSDVETNIPVKATVLPRTDYTHTGNSHRG